MNIEHIPTVNAEAEQQTHPTEEVLNHTEQIGIVDGVVGMIEYDVGRHWDPTTDAYSEMPPSVALSSPDSCPVAGLYHYCSLYTLPIFLELGAIPVWHENELPRICSMAWFSENPEYERGALAAGTLGLTDPEGKDAFRRVGVVQDAARIVVKATAVPYRFCRYWDWCGVSHLYTALRMAPPADDETLWNPAQWWGCPFPVDSSNWIGVELWDSSLLKWVPIQQTSDRMAAELIPLLPLHLRTAVPTDRRLPPDVKNSRWSLPQITDTPYMPIASPDHPPYRAEVTPERIAEYAFERARWRCANEFAEMGLAAFPVDQDGQPFETPVSAAASCQPDYVDREWLLRHPGSGLGLAFISACSGVFGLRLREWCQRQSLGGNRALPATVMLHEQAQGKNGSATVLLYRAPPALRVPSCVLRQTAHGSADVLGHGAWMLGPGRYGAGASAKSTVWDEGPGEPAPAPDWLIQAILQVSKGNCK